jgi:purine-binding chemotaxis protein CheW
VKFGLQAAEYSERTCIIVTQICRPAPMLTGMIVDAVSDIVNLAPGEIEDAPDFGRQVVCGDVLGLAKVHDQVKILLDIEKVVAADEPQMEGIL